MPVHGREAIRVANVPIILHDLHPVNEAAALIQTQNLVAHAAGQGETAVDPPQVVTVFDGELRHLRRLQCGTLDAVDGRAVELSATVAGNHGKVALGAARDSSV